MTKTSSPLLPSSSCKLCKGAGSYTVVADLEELPDETVECEDCTGEYVETEGQRRERERVARGGRCCIVCDRGGRCSRRR